MVFSMTTPQRKAVRRTTVPRWFVALAAVYGTVLTFLAASFILGIHSGSATHAGSALMTGFTQWWPSATTAAAVVAVVCVSFGIAASRKRRIRRAPAYRKAI